MGLVRVIQFRIVREKWGACCRRVLVKMKINFEVSEKCVEGHLDFGENWGGTCENVGREI